MYTSAGDTAFSSNFYVQTDFNQTELDELLNVITGIDCITLSDCHNSMLFSLFRASHS